MTCRTARKPQELRLHNDNDHVRLFKSTPRGQRSLIALLLFVQDAFLKASRQNHLPLRHLKTAEEMTGAADRALNTDPSGLAWSWIRDTARKAIVSIPERSTLAAAKPSGRSPSASAEAVLEPRAPETLDPKADPHPSGALFHRLPVRAKENFPIDAS